MGQDSPQEVLDLDEKVQIPTDADVPYGQLNRDNNATREDDLGTKSSNTPPELAKEPLEPVDSVEYPGTWKAVIIITALFLSVFLVALDQTIIGTAIPKITNRFNSVGDIGWYGSAYFLTSTALQPSFGRAYKVLNVRVHFFVCFFFFLFDYRR
jgi:hypothetical protein